MKRGLKEDLNEKRYKKEGLRIMKNVNVTEDNILSDGFIVRH